LEQPVFRATPQSFIEPLLRFFQCAIEAAFTVCGLLFYGVEGSTSPVLCDY
jgi:hypothetical protein